MFCFSVFQRKRRIHFLESIGSDTASFAVSHGYQVLPQNPNKYWAGQTLTFSLRAGLRWGMGMNLRVVGGEAPCPSSVRLASENTKTAGVKVLLCENSTLKQGRGRYTGKGTAAASASASGTGGKGTALNP